MEDFDVFFAFVKQKFFSKYFAGVEGRLVNCNYLYRSFHSTLRNKEGVLYKALLLEEMKRSFLGSGKVIASLAEGKQGFYLCSSIITFYLSSYARSRRLLQQGSLSYLPK